MHPENTRVFSGCTCTPNRFWGYSYLEVYDANNQMISSKMCYPDALQCTEYSNGGNTQNSRQCVSGTGSTVTDCTFQFGQYIVYTGGNSYSINTQIWCSGTVQANGSCKNGTWLWSSQNYSGSYNESHACTSYDTINWDDLTCN